VAFLLPTHTCGHQLPSVLQPPVTKSFLPYFSTVLFTPTRKQIVYMGVNMNRIESELTNYFRYVPLKAKREIERTNLLDVTANGVIIGVYRERVYEVVTRDNMEKRIFLSERLTLNVNRPYQRNRFAKIKHFPKQHLEQVLINANQIAQMEIQRATIAVAV